MRGPCRLALLALALAVAAAAAGGHDFRRDFDVVWGEGNARFLDGGRQVELSLDERTGARLQSKERPLRPRYQARPRRVRRDHHLLLRERSTVLDLWLGQLLNCIVALG